MKRRQAIMLLGGAAAAWPLAAWAQQPAEKLPRIGSIQNFQNENFEAFIQGLREAGYVDGQNMLLETRFYAGVLDRIDEKGDCAGGGHQIEQQAKLFGR